MVGDRARKAHEIFRRALDAEPPERPALVVEACRGDDALRADVDRLLAAIKNSTGFLENSALTRIGLVPVGERPADAAPGYRLGRVLGAGGMATVYEAEQLAPRRKVALKVLHPGLAHTSAGRRLRFEADVLARLRHPGIAQIYEVGSTGDAGRTPFIAMEYVEGARPITEYAREAELDLRAKLEMFALVCDAVQHGHQLGVIHRDLKPANIVVGSDGKPKVIDFGIARSAMPESDRITLAAERGHVIGTLSSMSPEQCSGEGNVDTRCDVYSLGVVLYELVTGRPPIDVSGKPLLEAIRAIQRDTPAKPGTLAARLPDELDAVILKTLEKDPRDRYATASELAADVRRFLQNRPVLARPSTTIEQVRKFARRNRVLVAGAAGLVVVLASAAGVTGWMAYVARDALAETRERAAELEDVIAFQQSQLRGVNVPEMGELLRSAIVKSRGVREEDRAGLERSLERVNFTSVALTALDRSLLEKSREAINERFAARPLVRARLLFTLASTMNILGLKDKAEAPLIDALSIRREQLGEEHEDTFQCKIAIAELYGSLGRLDEALASATGAYEGLKRVAGPTDQMTLAAWSTLGAVYRQRGEYAEARRAWAGTLEARRATLGDDDQDTLISLNNFGVICAVMEDLDTAETAWRELLDRRKRIYGAQSPEYRSSLSNLGLLLHERGKLDEAEPMLEESLASLRQNLGDTHPSTLSTMASVAELYKDGDRLEPALALTRECLEGRRVKFGPEHPATLRTTIEYSEVVGKLKRHDEALAMATEAVALQRKLLGNRHPDTVEGVGSLAGLALEAGDATLAEALAHEAAGLSLELEPGGDRSLAQWLLTHGMALMALGRFDEAESSLRRAAAVVEAHPRANDKLAGEVAEAIGALRGSK